MKLICQAKSHHVIPIRKSYFLVTPKQTYKMKCVKILRLKFSTEWDRLYAIGSKEMSPRSH